MPPLLPVRAQRKGTAHAGGPYGCIAGPPPTGLFGRLRGTVEQIWALRGVLLENRALLVRYGALLRFLNPGFLLLVVGVTVATGLLVPGALLAVLVVGVL